MNAVLVMDEKKLEYLKDNKIYKFIYLLLYLPCFFIKHSLDNDIWFILNNGRYVLQHGIPYIEPFTIHKGMSYVMQQWLSAVVFWNIYSFLGEIGLKLFVFLMYILFTYITFKLCMFLSDNNFFVSYVISFIINILINGFMVERPHLFLFIIMISEMYCVEKYIKFSKSKFLMPLLILSVLLINLEAAMWPLLFIILIPYIIDSFNFKFKFLEGQGYCKKSLFLTIIGMFLAGFLNPYGIKAMSYLFNSYGYEEMNYIQELSVANINTTMGKLIFGTVFIVAFTILIYKKRSYRLRYCLLGLGTAYMAISAIRSYCIFIICGLIPLSYYFKNYKLKNIDIKNDKKTLIIRKTLIVLIILVAAFNIYKTNNIDSDHRDLVNCVNYLDILNKNTINLYTGFNEGGYLEFRGYKVYIDPRAEIFLKNNNKKNDIMKEFISMESGKIYYKDVLNKYNFTYLLVSKDDILNTYLPFDNDYKLIYSSENYKIFEVIKTNNN